MTDNARPSSGAETIVWDLTHLYLSMDDPAILRDLDSADAGAAELDARYRGRIGSATAQELVDLLERYERVREQAARAGAFAYLNWASDTGDAARGALLQQITERGSRLSQALVFLELELAHATDEVARAWLADPELKRYRHWLEQIRRYRPHLLSEPEEKILAEKDVTGRSAWDRFFDELHSAARFNLDGEKLTRAQVLTRLYSSDRDLRRRAAAQ